MGGGITGRGADLIIIDDQVDAFNILLTRIFNVALKRATSTDGSGRPDRAPAPLSVNAASGAQRPRRVRQL